MMWYEIPEFPGYRINHRAEVMSLKGASGPRILTPQLNRHTGYMQVTLRQNGKTVCAKIHILMARTFLGPCPEGLQVCHGPRGQLNNSPGNLRYDTPSQNTLDQVKQGTHHEAARTHCDAGHKYTPANTMWRWGKGGKAGGIKYRGCRKCHAIYIARWRAKRKVASL
jgi:hypothetical protein